MTLFLKCLFVFTVLLNKTTFSWFICHMIGFILLLSADRFYSPYYFFRRNPTVFSCSHGGAFSPLPLVLQLSESQDIFTQLLKCGGLFWCLCNIAEGGISHTPSKSRLSMVESLVLTYLFILLKRGENWRKLVTSFKCFTSTEEYLKHMEMTWVMQRGFSSELALYSMKLALGHPAAKDFVVFSLNLDQTSMFIVNCYLTAI